MFKAFHEDVTGTLFQNVVIQSLCQNKAGPDLEGYERLDAVPFNVILGGEASAAGNGNYSGARVRISGIIGERQERIIFLDDRPRRYAGRAVALQIEGLPLIGTETVRITGALTWAPHADAEMSPVTVSNLITRKTISLAQATTDSAITAQASLGALQREARAVSFHCEALAGGAGALAVQIRIFGRRFVDQSMIRIGGIVPSDLQSGYERVVLVPGQFDQVDYQVVGFPAGDAYAATLFIHEELGAEG